MKRRNTHAEGYQRMRSRRSKIPLINVTGSQNLITLSKMTHDVLTQEGANMVIIRKGEDGQIYLEPIKAISCNTITTPRGPTHGAYRITSPLLVEELGVGIRECVWDDVSERLIIKGKVKSESLPCVPK